MGKVTSANVDKLLSHPECPDRLALKAALDWLAADKIPCQHIEVISLAKAMRRFADRERDRRAEPVARDTVDDLAVMRGAGL